MRATADGADAEWTHVPPSGEMNEGGVSVVFKQWHDEAGYYGCLSLKENWKRIDAVFDGEGKGVYSGPGVQGFHVLNTDNKAGEWEPTSSSLLLSPSPLHLYCASCGRCSRSQTRSGTSSSLGEKKPLALVP